MRVEGNRSRAAVWLVTFAAALLCSLSSVGVAQVASPVLSGEHKWVADRIDDAASQAERYWYKCIIDAPGRRNDQAWIDEVVARTCGHWLTLVLDIKTASIWINFKHRLPDIFLPNERLKEHKRLVDQVRRIANDPPFPSVPR